MYTILLVAHTILVIFLIIMVLIQRSDSDGLGSLGGGGGNQFMTGRGTANFMTRTTAILAAAFMITSLALATMASRIESRSVVDSAVVEEPVTTEKTVEKVAEKPVEKTAEKTVEKPDTPSVPKPE